MHGCLQEQLPEMLFLHLGQQGDGARDIVQAHCGGSFKEG